MEEYHQIEERAHQLTNENQQLKERTNQPTIRWFAASTYAWWCFVTWIWIACAVRKPGSPVSI